MFWDYREGRRRESASQRVGKSALLFLPMGDTREIGKRIELFHSRNKLAARRTRLAHSPFLHSSER
jgi:hypothetical protein